MTTSPQRTSQNISWNGISLTVPQSWETQVISLTHLSFECDSEVVLELRWQETKSRNNHKLITRITKQYEERSESHLTTTTLPPGCEVLFKDFQVACFTTTKQSSPLLIVLNNPDESFMLVLHVYTRQSTAHPLKSIGAIGRTTREDGLLTWAIQDFQALVPATYRLTKYAMKAGLTVLEFACGKTMLHLCRLSLAGQRLERQNLKEIFTSLLGLENEGSFEHLAENTVRYQAYPGILEQITIRLQRKKPFQLATFWHDGENDRLLGCFMQGIAPLDQQLHTTICKNYEIVPLPKK